MGSRAEGSTGKEDFTAKSEGHTLRKRSYPLPDLRSLLTPLRLSSDRSGATRHGHHRDRARNTRAGHVLLAPPFPPGA